MSFRPTPHASSRGILSKARKYRLKLIVAHQYTAQIDEALLAAIFGNVKTTVVFHLGAEDAEIMAKEMYNGTRADLERWTAILMNLPDFH
jgi:imidazolonepropionase-like amidohydrolase